MTTEERITNLEMTLAYQERVIEELNGIVFKQQNQIDALEMMSKHLSKKMREMGTPDILPVSEEPPPPHY